MLHCSLIGDDALKDDDMQWEHESQLPAAAAAAVAAPTK
jgi:hypothetical protein